MILRYRGHRRGFQPADRTRCHGPFLVRTASAPSGTLPAAHSPALRPWQPDRRRPDAVARLDPAWRGFDPRGRGPIRGRGRVSQAARRFHGPRRQGAAGGAGTTGAADGGGPRALVVLRGRKRGGLPRLKREGQPRAQGPWALRGRGGDRATAGRRVLGPGCQTVDAERILFRQTDGLVMIETRQSEISRSPIMRRHYSERCDPGPNAPGGFREGSSTSAGACRPGRILGTDRSGGGRVRAGRIFGRQSAPPAERGSWPRISLCFFPRSLSRTGRKRPIPGGNHFRRQMPAGEQSGSTQRS